jgi:tRNA A37 methylthiotransferase MiaB
MSKTNANLLIINPGFFYIGEYQKIIYYYDIPINILQLSSLLAEKGKIHNDIVDMRIEEIHYPGLNVEKPNFENFTKDFLKLMEKKEIQEYSNIAIICNSSFQYLQTELIAKIIKRNYPEFNLILAGEHVNATLNDYIMNSSPYNYVINGDLEFAFLDMFLSNIIRRNSNRFSIPKVISSNNAFNINDLPFPNYELYLSKYPYKDRFTFEISMSKGCPFKCTFCPNQYKISNMSFKLFIKYFEQLLDIVENYNKKVPKIAFNDRSFNSSSISKQVLNYIIKNNLRERFKFSCQSRIEIVNKYPELIDLFRKAGMIVGFGFETANKDLLIEMNKTKTPSQYLKKMKDIIHIYKNISDIYCRINIVLGFPGESKNTFKETVDFVNNYASHENIQIGPTLYSNYPNTYVYYNMEYYMEKFGSQFTKNWWKIPENPLKHSVPDKPSKYYSKKNLVKDYIETFLPILKRYQQGSFYSFQYLVLWKNFFNNWYKELLSNID